MSSKGKTVTFYFSGVCSLYEPENKSKRVNFVLDSMEQPESQEELTL